MHYFFLGDSLELNFVNNFFPKDVKFKYFDLYKELDEAKFLNPSVIRNRDIISAKKNSSLNGENVRKYATEDIVINKENKYLEEIIAYNKEELINAALFINKLYRIINDDSLIKYKIEQLK
ncbi:hypothetical protein [Spiroplasma endosymbiont of Labia minor]|uniref:hypothetical protein n=1 Tax=Spiroplasma endosymbiont of Labia minor TaxID=3066305 RepID=UPI0030D1AA81